MVFGVSILKTHKIAYAGKIDNLGNFRQLVERTDILECAWHRRQEEADDAELQAALVGVLVFQQFQLKSGMKNCLGDR